MDTVPGWYPHAADESPEWGPCPICGTANAANARFCQACGRPLVEPESDPLTVEVLTAVVCELVSSGETSALPPDADDRLVAARDPLVAAGATLRDLSGSPHTVAAVFGPASRDGVSTLTAVRAAIAAREAVTGGEVALRVGVGGSDVPGDDDRTVDRWRGRVVDLALRLSRMAAPGEVILGEGAYRLIRASVDAEAVDPRADLDGDDVGPLRLRGVFEFGDDRTSPWHEPAQGSEPPWLGTSGESAPVAETTGAPDDASIPIEPTWTDTWNDTFAWGLSPVEEPAGAEREGSDAGRWPVALEGASETQAFVGDETTPATQVEERPEADPWAGAQPVESEPGVEAGPMVASAPDEPPPGAGPAASPREPGGATLLERDGVLARLRDGLDRAIDGSRPVSITLGGPPGSGRTSVARWFAGETVDRAWAVEIGCRRVEEGGSSWPFASLVRAILAVDGPTERADLETRLRTALGDGGTEHAARLTAYLAGDAGGAPPDETRAAIAALVSATTALRPLLLIVDDAGRATSTARAIFDAVLAMITGPLLVVAITTEPGDVEVAPLSDGAVAELVERLLARPNLPPDAHSAIVAACAGIPLAVEHLVAMLADDGHLRWEYGRWTPSIDLSSLPLPADLPSLVARRVGGLRREERRVAAVAALTDALDTAAVGDALGVDADEVARVVESLTDRGVFRRDAGGRVTFGHDVIAEVAASYVDRDAAGVMHRRAADAIGERRHPGPDVDELLGAHLERAFRAAGADPARDAIGRRAAEHLVAAARGAADVGDEDASLALLRRAASVLPVHDAGRARLLLDSAATLAAREKRGPAERLLGDAIRAARAAGDELLELRASLARARMLATTSRMGDQIEALRDAAEATIAAATAREDPATLAAGWSARGWVHTIRGHFAAAAEAFERSAAGAAAAGRRRDELSSLADLAGAIIDGPAPVEGAIERCRALVARVRGTGVEPAIASALAVLLARAGRDADARAMLLPLLDAGTDDPSEPAIRTRAALVELHADAPEAAEAMLRSALDADAPPDALGTTHAWLAYVLAAVGRTDEALAAADAAARLAHEDDVVAQVTWRAAMARCLAVAGREGEARALVRLCLRLADQTDLSELRARTRLDLAEVLLSCGRANEAGPAARAALRALERKGSVAEARRARAILDRLSGRSPSSRTGEATRGGESQDDPHGETATLIDDPDDSAEGSADGGKRERRWFW